jgi:hypothetical protein
MKKEFCEHREAIAILSFIIIAVVVLLAVLENLIEKYVL